MAMSATFELENATKYFGMLKVFEIDELRIASGEIVAVVGPSGCGKSTLLACLAGLEPLTSGVNRFSVEGGGAASRRVGMVFQRTSVFPWLSVRQNLCVPGTSLAKLREGAVDGALAEFGLEEFADVWPKQLSGGMLRRLELARATLRAPEALLLDEPFAALDPATRSEMHALVSNIRSSRGVTMVLVTHDPDEAVSLSDRVVILSPRPGRIVREITVATPVAERGLFSVSPIQQVARNEVLAALREVSRD